MLEIEVAHPNEFASWTRWARQFDSALRLFLRHDLMLASLYCWQRGACSRWRKSKSKLMVKGRVLML